MAGNRGSRKVRKERAAKSRSNADRNRAKELASYEAILSRARAISQAELAASDKLAEEIEENRIGFVGSQGAV